MVITDLDNATEQIAFSEGLKKTINFLKDKNNTERDDPTFEAHRDYIDIQYVVSGTEILGWVPLDTVTITAPYDQEKDALLGKVPAEEWTPVRFESGQVIVLYPIDAHAPGLAIDQPEYVKKIVMKIALGS